MMYHLPGFSGLEFKIKWLSFLDFRSGIVYLKIILVISVRSQSRPPIYKPTIRLMIITVRVSLMVCSFLGQVTCLSSF